MPYRVHKLNEVLKTPRVWVAEIHVNSASTGVYAVIALVANHHQVPGDLVKSNRLRVEDRGTPP